MLVSLEINRTATVNAGSYNTIKPSITIKIDDVPEWQIEEKSKILSELADCLFAKEFLSISDEINSVMDVGFTAYTEALKTKQEFIEEKTEDLFKKLIG